MMTKGRPTGNAIRRGMCKDCIEFCEYFCNLQPEAGAMCPEGTCNMPDRSHYRSHEKQKYMKLSITLRISEINEAMFLIDRCPPSVGDLEARASLRKKLVKKRIKYARNAANRKLGAR